MCRWKNTLDSFRGLSVDSILWDWFQMASHLFILEDSSTLVPLLLVTTSSLTLMGAPLWIHPSGLRGVFIDSLGPAVHSFGPIGVVTLLECRLWLSFMVHAWYLHFASGCFLLRKTRLLLLGYGGGSFTSIRDSNVRVNWLPRSV